MKFVIYKLDDYPNAFEWELVHRNKVLARSGGMHDTREQCVKEITRLRSIRVASAPIIHIELKEKAK